jgi:hypothetical protein
MPKYQVAMHATIGLYVTVEADSEEAASIAAYEEAPGGICAQCSGWGRSWYKEESDYEVDEDEVFDGKVYKAVTLVEE